MTKDRNINGGSYVWSIAQRKKRSKALMLGLNEAMDQLSMANSVHWYGHVLIRALDLEVDGQRKKGRLKRIWKKQVEEDSVKVGLRR